MTRADNKPVLDNSTVSPSPSAPHQSVDALADARMHRVLFLLSAAVLINYIDRSNLSIAAPLLKDELGISAWQLGKLLSAFFWTYALLQIPAGWLVDRLEVKWVFATGFLIWSAATAITGVLHGFTALLVVRVILGVGESVAFPSFGKIIGGHFEESQRGFANSMIMVGIALGPAIGMLAGGSAVARLGWRPFFVVLGLGALLWLPLWFSWMPSGSRRQAKSARPAAGYRHIFQQRSAWGTCIGQGAINYYLYFLVTWLPFYVVRGRHFSLTAMARVGALVFLLSAISAAIYGKLGDHWIRGGASITRVRKGSMLVGCVGVGICLILAVIAPDPIMVAMLALTGIFVGLAGCNSWAIAQTLAGPHMVGRWIGVQNSIGNLAGAVAPALTGFLLDRTGSFFWPFFITAIVAWVGAVGWCLVAGPIEEVNWHECLNRQQLRRAAESTAP